MSVEKLTPEEEKDFKQALQEGKETVEKQKTGEKRESYEAKQELKRLKQEQDIQDSEARVDNALADVENLARNIDLGFDEAFLEEYAQDRTFSSLFNFFALGERAYKKLGNSNIGEQNESMRDFYTTVLTYDNLRTFISTLEKISDNLDAKIRQSGGTKNEQGRKHWMEQKHVLDVDKLARIKLRDLEKTRK